MERQRDSTQLPMPATTRWLCACSDFFSPVKCKPLAFPYETGTVQESLSMHPPEPKYPLFAGMIGMAFSGVTPVTCLVVVLAMLVSGCRDSSRQGDEKTAGTELRIHYVDSRVRPSKTQQWTLSCNPPGGNHPWPQAACAELAAHPHSLDPVERACTFASTQDAPFAAVAGHIHAHRIDRTVRPGCGPAWQQLPVLLSGLRGTAGTGGNGREGGSGR